MHTTKVALEIGQKMMSFQTGPYNDTLRRDRGIATSLVYTGIHPIIFALYTYLVTNQRTEWQDNFLM